jgi:hypothetical protein
MRSKSLLILIVLTVAVALAAVMVRKDTGDVAGAGEPMFPTLLDNINDITTVVGVSGGETFTLVRDAGRWVVSEKYGYPADQEKARQLILGMARMQRIESKTSNPDLYAKIGLDDINAEGSNAVQYSFKNSNGDTLAEIIIGNSRLGRADPQMNEYFVRKPDEAQAWLIESKLPDAVGALEWLNSKVLNVDRRRVRQVTVLHPDGAVVTISKKKPSQTRFDLHDVPEDAEMESEYTLSDLGRSLATLDTEDVIPASQASVSDNGLSVEMTTFDGLRVALQSVEEGSRTLARVEAFFDESLVAEEFLPGGDQAEPESEFLLDAKAVAEEVKRLNDEWRNWIFVLPEYRAKYMAVKKENMIKAPEKKDAS